MEYKLDFEKIKSVTGKKDKYTYGRRKITNVLPFPTREPERAKFDKGFISIVGGVVRKINGKGIREDMSENAIQELVELGNYKGEESEALIYVLP